MTENNTPEVTLTKAEKAEFDGLAPMFAILGGIVNTANTLATEIRTATSGKDDAVSVILNTSEDEEIVAFREKEAAGKKALAEIQAKIDALREAARAKAEALLPSVESGFDVAEAKKEFQSKRRAATQMKDTFLVVFEKDESKVKKALDYFGITEVISVGRNGAVSGAGGRKPRIGSATVDGVAVEDSKGKVTMTSLANHIGADTNDLVTAYLNAAGNPEKVPAGAVTSFTFSVGDKSRDIVITASEGNVKKDDEDVSEETVSEESTESE